MCGKLQQMLEKKAAKTPVFVVIKVSMITWPNVVIAHSQYDLILIKMSSAEATEFQL